MSKKHGTIRVMTVTLYIILGIVAVAVLLLCLYFAMMMAIAFIYHIVVIAPAEGIAQIAVASTGGKVKRKGNTITWEF